jgi:hypothetical protein
LRDAGRGNDGSPASRSAGNSDRVGLIGTPPSGGLTEKAIMV